MQSESAHTTSDLRQMVYFQIPLAGLACATACYSLGGHWYASISLFIASLLLAVTAHRNPRWFTPLARQMNRVIGAIATWVTWILLLIVFFLLLTPYAILLRGLGHRPLPSDFDTESTSYWNPRKLRDSKTSYFRQF